MTNIFQNDFLWRRFHSLMGVIPLGLFLAEHFFTNSHALNGPKAYEDAVMVIQGLPLLILFEAAIIVPLYFHAIYGLYRIAKSRGNVANYPYGRNWMYALQRWTGVIVLIFVTVHLVQFRFGVGWKFADVHNLMVQPAWLVAYVISVLATIFHFANGMWNFCINWGLTVGPRAQMISSWVWTGVGMALAVFGLGSIQGFLN